MKFPLKMLGADLQRNVTLLRLASGKLIVHSTAPFETADIAAIRELGEPTWLVDVLLRHDTFAAEGHAAFPEARYLAPPGFEAGKGIATDSLVPPPAEWADEIAVLPVAGAPEYSEIVMLHRPSRTLVVGDLLINFPGDQGFLTELMIRVAVVGGDSAPGVTRPLKHAIDDHAAFIESLETILAWDFDRIVVGHGEPVVADAREKLRAAYQAAGILTR